MDIKFILDIQHKVGLAVSCVFLWIILSSPAWSDQVDAVLQAGTKALQEENLDAAVDQFSHALTLGTLSRAQWVAGYEGLCAAQYKKSLAKENQELTQRAIANCDAAIAIKSDHQRAFRLRGTAYLTAGYPQKALEDLSVAAALDATDYLTFQNRGLAYAKLGKPQEAIRDFDTAISLNPDHPWSYYNRGRLHAAQGSHDKAIEDFSVFIRFKRDYEPVYLYRGRSWMEQNRYRQAISDFYESLRLQPNDNPRAHTYRGITLYLSDRYAEAMLDFEKAREIKPDDAQNRLWLYLTLERLGKPGTSALADLGDVNTKDHWPSAMFGFLQGKEEAEITLQTIRGLAKPDQMEEREDLALFFIGERAAIKGQADAAKKWFDRILAKPNSVGEWKHVTRQQLQHLSVAGTSKKIGLADMTPQKADVTVVVDPNFASHSPANKLAREKTDPNHPQKTVASGSLPSSEPSRLPKTATKPPKKTANPSVQDQNPLGSLKTAPMQSPHKPGSYAFKVASFEGSRYADQTLAEMTNLKLPVYTQSIDANGRHFTRVWVGPFVSEAEAQLAWQKVKTQTNRNPSHVRMR